jgi:hypothetical protein
MNLGKIIGGIGVLIAMYLLIRNADETAKIIQTISSNSIAGIATLQGR